MVHASRALNVVECAGTLSPGFLGMPKTEAQYQSVGALLSNTERSDRRQDRLCEPVRAFAQDQKNNGGGSEVRSVNITIAMRIYAVEIYFFCLFFFWVSIDRHPLLSIVNLRLRLFHRDIDFMAMPGGEKKKSRQQQVRKRGEACLRKGTIGGCHDLADDEAECRVPGRLAGDTKPHEQFAPKDDRCDREDLGCREDARIRVEAFSYQVRSPVAALAWFSALVDSLSWVIWIGGGKMARAAVSIKADKWHACPQHQGGGQAG